MKLPSDVQQLLTRRFQNKYRAWLMGQVFADAASAADLAGEWPLVINLGLPTQQSARQQMEGVRAWLAAWRDWRGAGTIVWCQKQWATLGQQNLPAKLLLQNASEVAAWVNESTRWQRATARYQQLTERWPQFVTRLPRYFDVLVDYHDDDFKRLLNVLRWIMANPHSNLYPRQLPVAGIDSKWLEKRKGLIVDLVNTLQLTATPLSDFYQCCGLTAPPQLIRLRILDPKISAQIGGLTDISAPIHEVARLNLSAKRVLIIENLQTGLAIPHLSDTVVILQLGYHVDVLGALPWVQQAQCYYWGDLDTHGFAILSRARTYQPNIQSFLMDEETLLKHRDFWGTEEKQHAATILPELTAAEQNVYQGIKQHRWQQNLRLEQERIAWDNVELTFSNLFCPTLCGKKLC